jgi:uncharacterized membrane protein
MTTATQERTEPRFRRFEERRVDRLSPSTDSERLAQLLGWFSIGLGLAQLATPRGVSRLIGVSASDENRKIMQAIGARELASGVGILTQAQPAGWLWSRVAGDVMDLALLGRGLNASTTNRNRVAAATAAVVGVTLLDTLAGSRLSRETDGMAVGAARGVREQRGVHVKTSITINRSPEEVYLFWRDFTNLPRFMAHLESVQVLDDRRSRWKARAPAGSSVEWDAEILEDQPNERIAWRSLQHADVANWGSVRFVPAPGGQGTEVHVELRYEPPGGAFGAAVAKLFGEEPGQQVRGDLRRLKQVLETGEVVHSDASIHAGPHPARPPERVPFSQQPEGGLP